MTEIEVTDPTHPLFGRRFPVLAIHRPQHNAGGHVIVAYREYMGLRIPYLSTNLAPSRPAGQTKLTGESLTDLISLAEQCEVLCLSNPQQSGRDCHPDSKPKSATTCRPSARR
ncbi:MAG: Y4bD/Y4pK family protein [Chloroflexi bacterium]|nr:Y4bD/Y4pK family protein [Chloroflexota bacterium]